VSRWTARILRAHAPKIFSGQKKLIAALGCVFWGFRAKITSGAGMPVSQRSLDGQWNEIKA
jgi:hypothetical protein